MSFSDYKKTRNFFISYVHNIVIVVSFCGVSWAASMLSQALWCFESFRVTDAVEELKESCNLKGMAEFGCGFKTLGIAEARRIRLFSG